MFDIDIPFETHITVDDFEKNREQEFVQFCNERVSKPLMIELSKGECLKQPILSKVTFANKLELILEKAQIIAKQLEQNNFVVKRIKIEVPSTKAYLFQKSNLASNNYFEWHGKIKLLEINKLLLVCKNHEVHLSQNSLKNECEMRFITLREFGNEKVFENRIYNLIDVLNIGGWQVLKQQSEYCVYDNNKLLDNGWLTI